MASRMREHAGSRGLLASWLAALPDAKRVRLQNGAFAYKTARSAYKTVAFGLQIPKGFDDAFAVNVGVDVRGRSLL